MTLENFTRLTGYKPEQKTPTKNDIMTMNAVRCIDCRQLKNQRRCDAGIGGTWIEFATGRQICCPPIDQWHYCIAYEARRGVRAARAVR